MKILPYISVAILLLTGCNRPQPHELSEIHDATPADSLVYYLGTLRGAEYNHEAKNDTTLSSVKARQQFLDGTRAGFEAVKDDDEAYNRGLLLGMQISMNINQFKEEYGVQLPERVFLEALAYAIENDSAINTGAVQGDLYRLVNRFSAEKQANDRKAASEALKQQAEKDGLTELSYNLYGKPTSGENLIKRGDIVNFSIKVTTEDGHEVEASFPSELVVGHRLADSPVTFALLTLSDGESARFLTSANDLFMQRAAQHNLKPDRLLWLDITVNSVRKD